MLNDKLRAFISLVPFSFAITELFLDSSKLVANSFTYFDNVRYRLHAWCIMPNHVHVIVEAMPDNVLFSIHGGIQKKLGYKTGNGDGKPIIFRLSLESGRETA